MPEVVAVGTSKGLFVYTGDDAGAWTLGAPHLPGWEVSAVLLQRRSAAPLRMLAATVHYAYGATIRETLDAGSSWQQLEGRPAHAEGSPYKLKRIWQIARAHPSKPATLYAGIDEAALFISRDDGHTWSELTGLTAQPSRKDWCAGGGGLCLHTIIADHSNPDRLWIGISAVGVFRSVDGGSTWDLAVNGIAEIAGAPVPMYCIHKIVQHPTDANTLFMQFHGGVYISHDGADSWQRIEHGLPSNFGFPMVITPRGTLINAPLRSDEQRVFPDGDCALYRSTDAGATWKPTSAGLPDEPTFSSVLRDSMTVDEAGKVFVGTTNGRVYMSADDGASWSSLPGTLPRVLCVRALAS